MKTSFLITWAKQACLSFCFVFTFILVYGQEEQVVTIPWEKYKVYTRSGQEVKVPYINGQSLDGIKPNFSWKKRIYTSANYNLSIEVIGKSPASKVDLDYLNRHSVKVGELDYDLAVSKARTERSINLRLFPFVKENGLIYRITDLKIKKDKAINTGGNAFIQKSFVSNSVLDNGSGFWYKIGVTRDGLFKIDKAFLEACGVDVSSLNPQHINIFGNGDGRLPELNSVYRTDDLAKNAILVVGEGDGSFDDGDYIVFHGWGPHRWYESGDKFINDRNPYSDVSYYYININPSDTPLRITSMPSSSSPATHTVNTFSHYDIHEQDLVNLVHGGKRWYGELFDTELQRSFSFKVNDIDPTVPARFDISIASNASTASLNTITYNVNGVTLGTENLPSVNSDYARFVGSYMLNSPASNLSLTATVVRSSPDILTYLDRIVLNARRDLSLSGGQMGFRDLIPVGAGNIAQYNVGSIPPTGFVWEVTDRRRPFLVEGSFGGGSFSFRSASDSLREFVASDGTTFFTPDRVGTVAYQNLHGLPQADYLIVTDAAFIGQANRLADLHRGNGLTVHVVTDDQIYNEFSSGMVDPTAIRMFAKMFYDRAIIDSTSSPDNLLLFGDGTFDPKNRVANNNNFIVTYQVDNSEHHIAALVTDDYFGLLDDDESIAAIDELDIGIGRLLISNNQMAKEQVDKVEHYMKNGSSLYSSDVSQCSAGNGVSTFGDWRNIYVQIADDEELQFIKKDCERQFDSVSVNYPEMNCEKIYMDAYKQVITAGGQRYPDVVDAINDRIERGALIVNYVGHGGEVGVAEERVITVPQIQSWRNIDNLPLMVSATCEFTKYDDPDRVSAGEWASINPLGAAIALMTTTRSVYYGVNEETGRAFFQNVFKRDDNYQPRTFGEIIRRTKNEAGTSSTNKRSFTLIGDPALQIALPRLNVVTDSINGIAPSVQIDTIRALSKVTIKGHLADHSGSVLTNFNGVLYPTVFDKPKAQKTLQNDPGAPLVNFETQTNRLYRGKVTVNNGYFEFTFVVPKDINYAFDLGKISYYAENGQTDAMGYDNRVYVGGVDPNGINDTEGPQIDLFLNDNTFVNGGITDEKPRLIAKVFDENGVNAVGNGVGHDITAVLDGETSKPFILNDYYSADLDSYQSGEINYNFQDISPGKHTLTLKVWDVNNNSSEATLDFVVRENKDMAIDHVLNYPNPFTTRTEFFFEHNQVCNALEAQIQIFTISGRLVRTINEVVHTEGYRSEGIVWDGRDDFGDQLAKGVYVYRMKVTSGTGSSDEKLEKLVILK